MPQANRCRGVRPKRIEQLSYGRPGNERPGKRKQTLG